jgi:polysaccharide biosynthesis PFTS motif protein
MIYKKQKKIINAYESLLSQDKISLIHELKRKIHLIEFKKEDKLFFFFLNFNKLEFNQALRQKLCLLLLHRSFNSKVLISKHENISIVFCVPNEWLKAISEFCRVSKILSLIKFYFFIFINGLKSIYKSTVWIYKLFTFRENCDVKLKSYILFNDLLYSNLPIVGNDDSNTIIDWYCDNYTEREKVEVISHTLKKEKYNYKNIIIVEEFNFLSIISFSKKIKILIFYIYQIFISIILFILGRWEYLLMINDILKSKFYKDISVDLLAREYLFSYSNLDYRPLWTYIVERRGAKVTFWAYASSLSGVKKANGTYNFTDYAWEISTWPTILVFTKMFKEYIENIIMYKSKVLLFDTPIPNSDNILPKTLFDRIKGKIVISMFDVSPTSDINAALLLHDPKYRTLANGKKFISDICEIFNDDIFFIILKIKRPIKKNFFYDTAYFDYLEVLPKIYNNVFLCHGDISAEKIIRISDLSISMPFTSTAFIASMKNVNTVFYDGSGLVQSDDINSQGIKLLSGKDQLLEFKKTIFK